MAYKVLGNSIPIIDDSRNILDAAAVGIGTTNPTSKLHVVGDTYISGIVTASRFRADVAQGTAPISVASSTRVDTLNVQYLDGNDSSFYRNASNLNAGAVPGAQVTQSSGLTITGNLSVSGNVSVSGTSFLVSAQQLRITDRDITLGVTTDANGNDISTDITANHGGIAIASTEGSPILNIPPQAGINTDPSTYKQMMWIKQGNYSGMGTDAWVFNYAVSIGNTASVQNLSRLTVGAGFTVFDTYLDAQDIRARNITAVTNINATGIVTAANGFNASSSSDYEINGTSVLNSTTLGGGVLNSSLTSVGILPTLNATNITNTNINSGGIHTAATYYVGGTKVLDTVNSQVSLVGIATLDATTKTTLERELAFAPNEFNSLNVSGISTLQSTTRIGGGTSTGTAGQVLQVTGISSGAYIGGNLGIGSTNPTSKLYVVGEGYFTGVVTATSFGGSGANLPNLTAGNRAGTIPSAVLGNSTVYVGTTAIALNRASASQSLTGITSIDGSAASLTNTRTLWGQNFNGTANVTGALTSVGDITGTGAVTLTATSGTLALTATGANAITASTNGTERVRVFGTGEVGVNTTVVTGTSSQALQVNSGAYISGNIGIGTTNPSVKLDVNGSVRFRSSITDNNNATGSANQVLTAGPSGAGVTWATLTATSVGAISGVTVTPDTATTTPLYLTFTSTTSGSITAVNVDTNGLTFIPSGSGSLGIGTTSPTRNLDVNGEIRLRAGLYDSTNQLGSLNQVLTVGAGGSVTWQAVTSVGAISGINVTQDDTGVRYPLLAAGTNSATTAQYVDATALVYNTSSNCLGIGSLTPTSRLDIIGDVKVVGIVTASDFNSSSDRKLKTNIKTITNPIEKVLQINGVSFNWKESGKATMGVIAQEVEAVLPELVSDTDPKSVNYNGLIGLLIECVKDQQRQIDELRNIT
jgi:hypothetical protein